MITTIDKAGRIIIPKTIREMAGLTAGTEVDLRYENGRIEIEAKHEFAELVEVGGRSVFRAPAPVATPPVTVNAGAVRELIVRQREDRQKRHWGKV